MQIAFQNYIKRNELTSEGSKILVAVSGGLDSMVLLELFRQTGGHEIGVAHVNFELRGKDSDQDEELVQSYCETWKINYHCKSADTNREASEKGESIQMAARRIRYRFFEDIMEKQHYDLLATAHHWDDQVENMMLTLIRGGIPKLIPVKNGRIIRPLLSFSKDNIKDFANTYSLQWREDKSNQKTDYQRNEIRHLILPQVEKLNPSFKETALKWAIGLDWHQRMANNELQRLNSLIIQENGFQEISGNLLTTLYQEPYLAMLFFRRYGFNHRQVTDMFESGVGANFYSESYNLTIDRKRWIIVKQQVKSKNRWIIEEPGGTLNTDFGVFCFEYSYDVDISKEAYLATMDSEKVLFPLTIRAWRDGDWFIPYGMTGKKKVSDFMIDQKIPLNLKDRFPLILDYHGQVIWIAGLRLSNHVRVTEATKKTLIIQYHDQSF